MIIVRCNNGVVGFNIVRLNDTNQWRWDCVNDGVTQLEPRTVQGLQDFLITMAQHAVALKGTVLQVVDLSELQL